MKKSWRTIFLAMLFFFFWLLLSGHYDFFHTFVGALCSAGLALWYKKLFAYNFFKDQFTGYRLRPIFFYGQYVFWLLWQIVLSAVAVTKAVLNPERIDPQIIRFQVDLKTAAARVMLGNSITLTPGTITVLLEDQNYTIHGLMDESASGLIDGSFQTMVARIHQKRPENVLKSVEIIKTKKRL